MQLPIPEVTCKILYYCTMYMQHIHHLKVLIRRPIHPYMECLVRLCLILRDDFTFSKVNGFKNCLFQVYTLVSSSPYSLLLFQQWYYMLVNALTQTPSYTSITEINRKEGIWPQYVCRQNRSIGRVGKSSVKKRTY